MPKLVPPLTDVRVRNAKPKEKDYKLADGGGMYLLVKTDGTRYWRMNYSFAGKAKTTAFGKYPEISLAEAREQRDRAKRLLRDGIDPVQQKSDLKLAVAAEAAQTFEKLAREWFEIKRISWRESTANDTIRRFEKHISPEIGAMPITTIKHPHTIAALKKIEDQDSVEVAHRTRVNCARVFSYVNPKGISTILGLLALAKGELKLGGMLSGLDESELDELLEERLAWSESYE